MCLAWRDGTPIPTHRSALLLDPRANFHACPPIVLLAPVATSSLAARDGRCGVALIAIML
ncbi:MAG: hypothetical protein BGO80_10265 [Devosia sp. 63-57]|nr:MAG: hypothetical protein ABS74_07725 [Pelagibacterium sp. SCN 63-126]OJX41936.1 MAG: hypothetical protein BGO80_10265 [Devosia sp. 63-57]